MKPTYWWGPTSGGIWMGCDGYQILYNVYITYSTMAEGAGDGKDVTNLAFRATISQLANVPVEDVLIQSLVPYDEDATDGLVLADSSLTTAQAIYSIYLSDVTALGYSTADEAYTSITAALRTSVLDNTFTQALQANAQQYGSTELATSTSNSVTFSQMQTGQPTDSTKNSQIWSTTTLAGIAAGGAFVLVVIAAAVLWYRRRKAQPSATAEFELTMQTTAAGQARSDFVNPMTRASNTV